MSARARPHNLPLEGLRGLAAMMVLYCHSFTPFPEVDPHYGPSPWFWTIESGQAAVALFFVISGFVIGLTNRLAWSPAAAGDYLWRRFVRLVPLYVCAILLSEAVRPADPPARVLGNLLFLQHDIPLGGWKLPALVANTNLWSLNYEVIYYLAFLAIWRFRLNLPLLMAAAAGFSAVGYYDPSLVPALLSTYAAGWVFWLAGLWLAWSVQPAETATPTEPWPSLLLLFVLQWKCKLFFQFIHRLHGATNPNPGPLSLINLDFIPICVLLVALVTDRRGRAFELVRTLCLLLPALYWIWRAVHRTALQGPQDYADIGLLVAAAALWRWRPSLRFFFALSFSGFLCYGLYIFQRPAQALVCYRLGLPEGSAGSYMLRLAVLLPLTFALAWLGERRLQPLLRSGLETLRRRAPLPPL